ncbi:hypothetical protein CPB84DRAFT_1852529 [Gymnopilus junonius]|uniref:F-box domain-containing protein n=1 Tax=Gymnopilus junonius TaxID=109634 RepID=A0A9P5NA57_GYMJU|nr:hypothetical protein CPB84DRAFT_1852529 [Gymnopilus junonius]
MKQGLQDSIAGPSITECLPVEIMSIIFEFYVPKFPPKESPFTIGAVCRKLRQIAWSTPQIWIHLSLDICGTGTLETPVQLAEDWLSQSGKLPLSISFTLYVTKEYDNHVVDHVYRFIDVINEHCNHCGSTSRRMCARHAQLEFFYLRVTCAKSEELFFANITLPDLKHLSVYGSDYTVLRAEQLIPFLTYSSTSSMLRSFSIDDADYAGEDLIRRARSMSALEKLDTKHVKAMWMPSTTLSQVIFPPLITQPLVLRNHYSLRPKLSDGTRVAHFHGSPSQTFSFRSHRTNLLLAVAATDDGYGNDQDLLRTR